MTQHPFSAVNEFHNAFGVPVLPAPEWPSEERRSLRRRLLMEEVRELSEADAGHDMIEFADALADIVYIVMGTALEHGIPLDIVFDIVQKTNMAKLGPDGKPIYRGDGKVLKPEGWVPPTVLIENELMARGWTPEVDRAAREATHRMLEERLAVTQQSGGQFQDHIDQQKPIDISRA